MCWLGSKTWVWRSQDRPITQNHIVRNSKQPVKRCSGLIWETLTNGPTSTGKKSKMFFLSSPKRSFLNQQNFERFLWLFWRHSLSECVDNKNPWKWQVLVTLFRGSRDPGSLDHKPSLLTARPSLHPMTYFLFFRCNWNNWLIWHKGGISTQLSS